MKISTTLYRVKINQLLWIVFVLYFSYQMFSLIWPYTSWERDVDFLMTKQMIIHLDHYRFAFYAHIFSSLIVLVCGAFLFSNYILSKFTKVHRILGQTYVFLLLFISAPSGLIMSFYANGGWLAKMSFLILTPMWWYFTFEGLRTVLQKNFRAHKLWMMRSYALSLSAITLRISQYIFGYFDVLDEQTFYVIISWGSWVLNLFIVESLIYFKYRKRNSISLRGLNQSEPIKAI